MTIRILQGDCRDVLRDLPAESVHCVVTSPPYFGLRDYGTATWEGGNDDCDHSPEKRGGRFATPVSAKQARNNGSGTASRRDCSCGARRIDNQIGLEQTPDEYVAAMVAVFRELRRVLRKDGTVWLNLGDTYAGGGRGGNPEESPHRKQATNVGSVTGITKNRWPISDGMKPKDLYGIPWMVAFALRADGWWLRQDIIWSKPNPMPESVTDRCTKAHEYIFLLSKSERYHYDANAIAELATERLNGSGNKERKDATERGCPASGVDGSIPWQGTHRNKRSVWEVATQPYADAHFATFPPALIEPCILAGCPKECCAKCGAPWVRNCEREKPKSDRQARGKALTSPRCDGSPWNENNGRGFLPTNIIQIGWSPSCSCDAPTVPGTILDPFGGAGTTGLVADRLGRDAILIELNEAYASMARRRIQDDAPLFADVI